MQLKSSLKPIGLSQPRSGEMFMASRLSHRPKLRQERNVLTAAH